MGERELNKFICSYMLQMIQDYMEIATYCLKLVVVGSIRSWWGQSNLLASQSPRTWISSKAKETGCFFLNAQSSTGFLALHQQKNSWKGSSLKAVAHTHSKGIPLPILTQVPCAGCSLQFTHCAKSSNATVIFHFSRARKKLAFLDTFPSTHTTWGNTGFCPFWHKDL